MAEYVSAIYDYLDLARSYVKALGLENALKVVQVLLDHAPGSPARDLDGIYVPGPEVLIGLCISSVLERKRVGYGHDARRSRYESSDRKRRSVASYPISSASAAATTCYHPLGSVVLWVVTKQTGFPLGMGMDALVPLGCQWILVQVKIWKT
jgi:hypothetical protein